MGAVQNPTYQPAFRLIASISQSRHAVVTTTFDHDYKDGAIVRLVVPQEFGMSQVNDMVTPIELLSPTSFRTTINTLNFDPFVFVNCKPYPGCTPAQVVPIGELTRTFLSATKNVLPYP